jgi:hypothetical protein
MKSTEKWAWGNRLVGLDLHNHTRVPNSSSKIIRVDMGIRLLMVLQNWLGSYQAQRPYNVEPAFERDANLAKHSSSAVSPTSSREKVMLGEVGRISEELVLRINVP